MDSGAGSNVEIRHIKICFPAAGGLLYSTGRNYAYKQIDRFFSLIENEIRTTDQLQDISKARTTRKDADIERVEKISADPLLIPHPFATPYVPALLL